MSNNYHSGTNSLATPRIHSGQNSQSYAQTLMQQAKTHRSESKYPENSKEKKSPINNILTSPKYQLENYEVETREENVDKNKNGYLQHAHLLSGKELKKVSQSVKENIHNNKTISPLKQELNPSKRNRKVPANVGPLVIINEYETSRNKPNSAKSMSLQRDAFQQHLHEAGDWLSNKVQSTRNPIANDTSGHKVQSLDLGSDFKSILRKHQQSTTDLHNIWPEAKKAKKVEILSHRDNLETPRDNDLTNKSDPKHLDLSPIRSSHAVVRHKKSHTGGSEKEVRGIVKHKLTSPKEKELSHIKLSAREHTSHLSPQNFDIRQLHSRGLSSEIQRSITRDSINLNQQKLDLPFISKYDMGSPNSLQNNDYFSNKISMSPSQTPILSGTTTEEVRPQLHLRLGKKFDISVHTSISRPLNLADNNIKSNRDSEVQFEPYSMMSGDQIFSTRSALDRCDNRLNIAASGIKELQPQRIYSHANTNKNTPIQNGENKNPVTQQIINELLKRTNSKETFVNPNAKFLLLRKQVQEKRGKSTFKSADWSIPNSPNNDLCHFQEGTAKDSSKAKQAKTPEPESTTLRNQMEQLINKTKLMMRDFRNKENKWEKEKEALLTEIRHLRSIIENL